MSPFSTKSVQYGIPECIQRVLYRRRHFVLTWTPIECRVAIHAYPSAVLPICPAMFDKMFMCSRIVRKRWCSFNCPHSPALSGSQVQITCPENCFKSFALTGGIEVLDLTKEINGREIHERTIKARNQRLKSTSKINSFTNQIVPAKSESEQKRRRRLYRANQKECFTVQLTDVGAM